jgi:hypothetical protein
MVVFYIVEFIILYSFHGPSTLFNNINILYLLIAEALTLYFYEMSSLFSISEFH